jgi:hypothetical protein
MLVVVMQARAHFLLQLYYFTAACSSGPCHF